MDFDSLIVLLETQGIQLLYGIIVLVVGLFIAHWIMKLYGKKKPSIKIEPTLQGFIENLIRLALYIVVVLTAASVMGIPMTSVITLLASAGVAISLALQGALSNFVGGMTILILKLFHAGDYVKIGDIEGSVQSIGVFYTELTTPDNRHISMPNSSLTNTAIVNFSREGTRRLDIVFSVGYESDIQTVIDTLMSVVRRTDNILSEPAPVVKLTQCADSSLNFTIRVWCKSADYWTINWSLLENGKRALDDAGIGIPYPQLDVHLKSS